MILDGSAIESRVESVTPVPVRLGKNEVEEMLPEVGSSTRAIPELPDGTGNAIPDK